MLKLLKYEFRKTFFTKLILLGVTAVAEASFLISLFTDHENWLAGSIVILTLLAVGGIMVIGLESILTLHRDMNTKQSYMLFMTPNSCYSILGAKVIETSLSIMITGLFFFVLGALDITLLFARLGELNEIWRMIQDLIHVINSEIQITAPNIAALMFSILCGWIGVITSVFLADVISTALLYGKKHNGIVSFIIFLALSWATGWLAQKLTGNITPLLTALVLQGVIDLVLACIMYFATAQIMERKLSV